ncbi:MAG: histidine kinase [Pseudomonadota bacterium]
MKRRTIMAVALMWLTVGIVHGLSRYADIVRYELDVPFAAADIGYFMLSYAFWIIITLVLLKAMARSRFAPVPMGGLFIAGLVLWLPVYFAFDYGVATLVAGGGWRDWLARLAGTSGSVVFFYAVVYALTFALCVGVTQAGAAGEAQQRNLELERQRANTAEQLAAQQMQLMQSQLSPHFLFNSLGAMSYLARRDERETLVSGIATLGSLLRFTVSNAARHTLSLAEEIQFAEDYIGLQSLRFRSRFRCTFSVTSGIEGAQCPPFTIQPLLENVFRHVIEQRPEGEDPAIPVEIIVQIRCAEDRVALVVRNTRPVDVATPKSSTDAGTGTGIKNLKVRLAHTYGSAFTYDQEETDAGFAVTLTFPMEPPDDDL